jgi:hypothetical protein
VYISAADDPPGRCTEAVQQLCKIKYTIGMDWDDMREFVDDSGRKQRRAGDLALTMRFDGEPKWTLKAGRTTVEEDVNVEYVDKGVIEHGHDYR